ncbi:MAG: dihydroneopterin aldolase [Candidatus Limnocylindrales bacterium]|jgi:dihydroneopterin aldolase
MSDRIALINMQFEGRHGVLEEERLNAQPFEVDVELSLDLAPAGTADDLSQTVDYREVFEICREVVEGPSVQLIEALAERIATRLLAELEAAAVSEVLVRVRKPKVMLPGALDGAAVEITRRPPAPRS